MRHINDSRTVKVRAAQLGIRIGVAVLFLAGAGDALAQRSQLSDEAVARAVVERLMSHDVTGVSVTVESHIVTLRGTVPTLWMKDRAREQALKVPDVVTVLSEITVARGESDEVIAGLVAEQLRRYVFLTIFDDADVEVDHGVVTLTGRVTMPYKAEAFADFAARVPGVQAVRNEVKTLPVSRFDDQLRYAVARGIYGDELFARYAIQANPPVHIIVEHGNVTLTGVVFSEVERRKAEAIARSTFAVMSVTNKLRIESED
jgi:hyperosmotically inducible protein